MNLTTALLIAVLGTVPAASSRVEYSAVGGTAFTFAFKTTSTAHVKVFLDDVYQATGYSVVLNANQNSSPGGTVTFIATPVTGQKVRIERTVPIQNDATFEGVTFKAKSLDAVHDQLVMQTQQIDRRVGDAEKTHSDDFNGLEDYVNGLAAGGLVTLPQSWTITANGILQVFPLPGIDVSSATSYWVYVDGVAQKPTVDYSIDASADTITFTSAPALGASIEVRSVTYSKAQAINDNTTVTATGSTTARAIKDRWADAVNVKDFGCKGDGATDDTGCFSAAGTIGKRIFLPPGTYKLTSVSLTAGTVLVAQDPAQTVLQFVGPAPAAPSAAISLSGVGAGLENIGISITAGDYRRGVDMRASGTFVRRCAINVTTPNIIAPNFIFVIFASQGAGSPMTSLVIEGNDIQGSGARLEDAIQASYVPGIRVVGNRIHDFTTTVPDFHSWGVYVSSCSPGAIIEKNHITGVNISGIHSGGGTSDSPANVGRRIVGNYIDNTGGVGYGIALDASPGAVVAENQIINAVFPLSLNGSAAVKITGNHIENASGANPFVQIAADCPSTVVTGNTFGTAGSGTFGVYTVAADTTIVANRFDTASPSQSVYAGTGSARVRVASNSFAPASSGSNPVIRVLDADAIVTGNTIQSGTGPGVTAAGASPTVAENRIIGGTFGIWVTGTATNAVVVNNSISGNSGGSLVKDGTAAVSTPNTFAGKPTRMSGVTSAIATGATVTHGLGATPTSVMLTAADGTPTAVYPSALGATTFAINYTGGGTHVFYWTAEAN